MLTLRVQKNLTNTVKNTLDSEVFYGKVNNQR